MDFLVLSAASHGAGISCSVERTSRGADSGGERSSSYPKIKSGGEKGGAWKQSETNYCIFIHHLK
uniref:Uncharacterized protein n=1 Tax=Anguilla anguilla TaxID=7936 RepID=A0A0E9U604_ANGAN